MGFPTGPDTDNWTVKKVPWFKDIVNQKREVRLIVIHTMEAPETDNTAENVARYFQNLPPTRKASAHLCIDNNSIVQCVFDNDVAFAAPGANHNGIQLELAGFSSQGKDDWADPYSQALLENAAKAAAQYCLKYNLPRKHLTNTELQGGKEGIIGHVQASDVFKKSDHGDPGKNFPWDHFVARVEHYYQERKATLNV
jgi:N-acetyl-anhydromuramyl-L-alanine amidase AmpD